MRSPVQPKRKTVSSCLRTSVRCSHRPRRKETAVPLSSQNMDSLHWHNRLQFQMHLLPKLGYFTGSVQFTRISPEQGDRHRGRVQRILRDGALLLSRIPRKPSETKELQEHRLHLQRAHDLGRICTRHSETSPRKRIKMRLCDQWRHDRGASQIHPAVCRRAQHRPQILEPEVLPPAVRRELPERAS